MNTQEFTYLLSHPEELNAVHTANIDDIITHYPYFQAARALYLKGLKTKESFNYNQELRITAAYTTDRSILFDFITSEAFNQNEISKLIKQNIELLKGIDVTDPDDISLRKSVTLEDTLRQQIQDSERILDPNLFEEMAPQPPAVIESDIPIIDMDVKNIEPSPEAQLRIGKPLEFDENETHSFTQWLKITNFEPIVRASEEVSTKIKTPIKAIIEEPKTESALGKKLDLIDKFITSNPKIAPVKESKPSINLAQTQLVQNDSLMTETLARIYLEQKNYEKAIQSYKILILKYPEKSGFFADQIKAVKQIQANNTK